MLLVSEGGETAQVDEAWGGYGSRGRLWWDGWILQLESRGFVIDLVTRSSSRRYLEICTSTNEVTPRGYRWVSY